MVSTSVTGRRPETHRSIRSLKSEAESQFEGSNEEAIPSSLVGQARADAHDAGRIPTLGRRERAPPRRAAARAGDGQRVIRAAAGGARAGSGRAIRRRSLAVVERGGARRDDPVGFFAPLRRASRAPRTAFALSLNSISSAINVIQEES